MLIYAILLACALAAALLNEGRHRGWSLGLSLYFVALLVFLGFRYRIGPDWRAYEANYDTALSVPASELTDYREPGFFLLSKFCDWAGLGFQGLVFACAAVFLAGCFSFARKTSNPWMSVASVLPYLVYIIAGSGLRQSASIGIGLYVMANVGRLSLAAKLMAIGVAGSIHNSAVVLLIFVVVSLRTGLFLRGVMLAAVAGIVAYVAADSEAVETYREVYLVHNVVSEGAFFHVLLIAFPAALYLIYRKRIVAAIGDERNVHLASYMAVGTIPLLSLSSTGFDRLSLYLSFVQMWVYPALVEAQVAPRWFLLAGFTTITSATFLVYFIFGLLVSAYVPYANVLFLD